MIIIVGAGLSGILTAYYLKKEGIPFKILESRNRVGGRINTIYKKAEAPVEMGATWLVNQHVHLIALLKELGIETFEQYMDSTVFYQPDSNFPAKVVQIPENEPIYRISGGTSNLIQRLIQNLDPSDLLLNQEVTHIIYNENGFSIKATEQFDVEAIVLALPPKLWANRISFTPKLNIELMTIAKQTHTWMEDSIKLALTFRQPFWKEENIPRTFFSNIGPVTEFYDQSDLEQSRYALCGFISSSFNHLSYSERQKLVIDQLKSVFGARITEFLNYEECAWSEEAQTYQLSYPSLFPHQNNGNPIFRNPYFDERLLISGSETSSQFPGYMEGAVIAAKETVRKIVELQLK